MPENGVGSIYLLTLALVHNVVGVMRHGCHSPRRYSACELVIRGVADWLVESIAVLLPGCWSTVLTNSDLHVPVGMVICLMLQATSVAVVQDLATQGMLTNRHS
jgi:hypothetical protein